LYLHTINKQKGSVQCHKHSSSHQELELTGSTNFDPKQEIIKSIHYPSRNEVIQTPSNILADDSLLYPHMMVVVTEISHEYLSKIEEDDDHNNFFVAVMNNVVSGSTTTTTKKKPVGVKPTNTTTTSVPLHKTNIPTLFITLVDTASCRILHRVSHSHKTSSSYKNTEQQTLPQTPLIISENWIVYSYFNHKTKRTELSVLTLYEGMIDKHGITAFNTPEQETLFDSFTFPKPIVLQKTYTISKSISTIGVTSTSRGITSKQFIFGLGSIGWILTIDSRMLDPRRPNSELKTNEKLEGLIRYTPSIPIISTNILSYNLNIEQPTQIISTSVRLESQSLIFAFGGPDLFFSRIAPSKGFDLLPDNFNKLLLGVCVLALLVVLFCARVICERRIIKSAWA